VTLAACYSGVVKNVGLVAAGLVVLGAVAAGCGKDSRAASQGVDSASAPAQNANCGHSACGSNFFLDTAPGGDCAAGAPCSLSIKLVATGDFHINEDYPYKFKADDTPGVEFLGADAAGKNTFSKAASDWKKKDEKTGTMTVAFRSTDKGQRTVGGTFKLSVCSAQTCQLEQQQVQATVAVR
jgi:hypothetical protein